MQCTPPPPSASVRAGNADDLAAGHRARRSRQRLGRPCRGRARRSARSTAAVAERRSSGRASRPPSRPRARVARQQLELGRRRGRPSAGRRAFSAHRVEVRVARRRRSGAARGPAPERAITLSTWPSVSRPRPAPSPSHTTRPAPRTVRSSCLDPLARQRRGCGWGSAGTARSSPACPRRRPRSSRPRAPASPRRSARCRGGRAGGRRRRRPVVRGECLAPRVEAEVTPARRRGRRVPSGHDDRPAVAQPRVVDRQGDDLDVLGRQRVGAHRRRGLRCATIVTGSNAATAATVAACASRAASISCRATPPRAQATRSGQLVGRPLGRHSQGGGKSGIDGGHDGSVAAGVRRSQRVDSALTDPLAAATAM